MEEANKEYMDINLLRIGQQMEILNKQLEKINVNFESINKNLSGISWNLKLLNDSKK